MSYFINYVNDPEWGSYYELTKAGYIAIVILMIIIIGVAAYLVGRKQDAGRFDVKKLTCAGISLALAFVTSYIKFEMPMGGSITLFSMFFICFVGYAFGVKVGFITAFAYSILQFIQTGGSYFLSPFQICCDYFFAFTALGIAGFWFGKKNGLVKGYIVAALVRGVFHTIGGYIYWMDYMPEWFPQSLRNVYSIAYNYSYILSEMIITLIIINIPAVRSSIERIKNIVTPAVQNS
ncbi:MAG: energy-coupled thiamine transporter ThiT [Lachnospiraceae bacterium]|nr:energy-coupled thiamine transporter ThiT [Lachnospiraceae bacterium]